MLYSPEQVVSELRGITCHIGSCSVACHPSQVNMPRHNDSQSGQYSIYLPWRDGRLSWSRWLVTYRNILPTHRRSAIQVLTRQCTARSWTRNLTT